jgi:hypothetical protein
VSYYYLASQLPYLVYGQAAPMTPQAFKNLCGQILGPKDTALLEVCSLDPEPVPATEDAPAYAEPPGRTPSEFINAWRNWERTLRLHLARFRAQKLKWENAAPVDPPENPMEAATVARAAAVLESPLEAELFLDQARWNAIESLQGLAYFSANTIYAYLLKLYLMERRALFKTEEGFAEYKGLYTAILAAASGSEQNVESGVPK